MSDRRLMKLTGTSEEQVRQVLDQCGIVDPERIDDVGESEAAGLQPVAVDPQGLQIAITIGVEGLHGLAIDGHLPLLDPVTVETGAVRFVAGSHLEPSSIDDLAAEWGQAAVPRRVRRGVGPVDVVVVRQGHVPDAEGAQGPEGPEGSVAATCRSPACSSAAPAPRCRRT